jgi:hypothetical protein
VKSKRTTKLDSNISIKPPKRVIRYFDREEHAKALMEGYVRISTLDFIRNMESLRADQEDATIEYMVDSAYFDSNGRPNEKMQYLHRLGVAPKTSNASSLMLWNVTVPVTHPNAYVYSTSCVANDQKIMRVFGQYQVAIADPLDFARVVTSRLTAKISSDGTARWGLVGYEGRSFSGDHMPPNPAFVSVPSLAYEKEYRFLWAPRKTLVLEPIIIHAPDIVRLCTRIA